MLFSQMMTIMYKVVTRDSTTGSEVEDYLNI